MEKIQNNSNSYTQNARLGMKTSALGGSYQQHGQTSLPATTYKLLDAAKLGWGQTGKEIN